MKKQIFSLICLVVFIASCSDDEGNEKISFDKSVIQTAESFLDERDSTTYECVRIGDQVWMAENLRYQIPGNAYSGAYTWNERVVGLDKIAIDNNVFMATVERIADDPQYEKWSEYDFGFNGMIFATGDKQIKSELNGLKRGRETQSQVLTTYLLYYTNFYNIFIEVIDEVKKTPQVRDKAGYEFFLNAERSNGGYVATHGFLYSHEAALAAVPEGWRLPSDEDWQKLESSLGLTAEEVKKNEAWRGPGLATLLNEGGESGFNAKYAGGNVYINNNSQLYLNKNSNWYYWSSTQFKENDSTSVAMIRMSAEYTDEVWRGTSRVTTGYRDVLYNVRCVKDAK